MRGAPRVAAAPRLYDRTRELAAVAALSARAAQGAGAVLLLTGGPGTGRTALLDRAVRDARIRALRVAAPGGNRVPWSGVRALLAALAPTPSAARRALRAAKGPGGVPGALAALCPGEPLLLCLDDHHLWDAHSRTALDAAWRARTGPWAWVVSFAAYHRAPDVPGARLLSLGRLSRTGARGLLDDVCRVPLTEPCRTRLLDEAAGHPGVLVAAARLSAEPRHAEGAERSSGPVIDDTSLAEVYRGLLGSLPAECGRVLTLVAVAGEPPSGTGRPVTAHPVDADAVLAVARAVRASPEALDRLVADGLLRGGREALRFDDPLLRRAVLGSLPPSRRRELTALFAAPGAGRPAGGDGPAGTVRVPEGTTELPAVVRGRAELARGLAGLGDGPVGDAHQALLLAAGLLREAAPEEAAQARFLAMEAAWAAGDPEACALALGGADDLDAGAGSGTSADAGERDFRHGMGAALAVRPEEARAPLARVVARDGASEEPRRL
ncbi:AAA family ATPase, partial [Streptomyces sp. NPDC004787]|uniref:AAA family ATPase n=1 Tax=Streptomyces sp. NPDC004787 TaxID=3154291 RepID=UPI0033B7D376